MNRLLRHLVCTSALMVILLGGLVGFAKWRYGSVNSALKALRGHEVGVEPPSHDLGELMPGQVVDVPFVLKNMRDTPVRLLGVASTCSCVSTILQAPLTLEPRQRQVISVTLRCPSQQGRFAQAVRIYTDCAVDREIMLRVLWQTPDSARVSVANRD